MKNLFFKFEIDDHKYGAHTIFNKQNEADLVKLIDDKFAFNDINNDGYLSFQELLKGVEDN